MKLRKDRVKSKSVIAHNFGIVQSNLSNFLKNEDKLRSDLSTEGSTKTAKRLRRPKFGNLNQCVVQWFKQIRCYKNIPISGPLIQAQAEKFASLLNLSDFKASSGWLHKLKKKMKPCSKMCVGKVVP